MAKEDYYFSRRFALSLTDWFKLAAVEAQLRKNMPPTDVFADIDVVARTLNLEQSHAEELVKKVYAIRNNKKDAALRDASDMTNLQFMADLGIISQRAANVLRYEIKSPNLSRIYESQMQRQKWDSLPQSGDVCHVEIFKILTAFGVKLEMQLPLNIELAYKIVSCGVKELKKADSTKPKNERVLKHTVKDILSGVATSDPQTFTDICSVLEMAGVSRLALNVHLGQAKL